MGQLPPVFEQLRGTKIPSRKSQVRRKAAATFVIPAKVCPVSAHGGRESRRAADAVQIFIPWYENRRAHDASLKKTAATFVIPAKVCPVPAYGGREFRGAADVVRVFIPWGASPSDCCENRARTPIRGRLPNRQHGALPSSDGRRRGGSVARSKTTRGEGLVPRRGMGGEWIKTPCRTQAPSPASQEPPGTP